MSRQDVQKEVASILLGHSTETERSRLARQATRLLKHTWIPSFNVLLVMEEFGPLDNGVIGGV